MIGRLIDEFFLETWHSKYYLTCSPSLCSYTCVRRNDVKYMTTTFLCLYGGLTIGINFRAWYGLSVYRKLCPCFDGHRYRVEPMNVKR